MTDHRPLGPFELTVLSICVRLGDSAYGASIMREHKALTSKEVSVGALYTTLDRLEEKGLISSTLGEPTPQRGGKSKRFISVNPAGKQALRATEHHHQKLRTALQLTEAT